MAWWFVRGLRRGIVTTHYPFRPEPSVRALSTPPVFRVDLLTEQLADQLIARCPTGALSRNRGTFVYDVGACVSCRRCMDVDERVVRPSGEVELAALRRDDLVKRISLAGGSP
jgi:hypothetical protein